MAALRTEVHVDPDNAGGLIVARFCDIDEMKRVADVCKSLHNEGFYGSPDLRVMGHYPAAIIESYIHRNGMSFKEFMRDPVHAKNIMRDPTLSYFRVHGGAV